MARTTTTAATRYLRTFFEEKDIDREATFELEGPSGVNLMSYGVVIEAILGAPQDEQKGIGDMIRRIDFLNGDVRRYLRHLAAALVL